MMNEWYSTIALFLESLQCIKYTWCVIVISFHIINACDIRWCISHDSLSPYLLFFLFKKLCASVK